MRFHHVALVTTSCIVALAVVIAAGGQSSPEAALAGPDQAVRARQQSAFISGGLRAAASITGDIVVRSSYPTAGNPASLEELADITDLIVVGSAGSGAGTMTPDGRSVVSIYSVPVTRVLKGREPGTGVVQVVVKGGRVGFEDGSTATELVNGFLPPLPGHQYVWFLKRAQGQAQAAGAREVGLGEFFELVRGGIGLYDLSADNVYYVVPSGDLRGHVGVELRRAKLPPLQFLDYVVDSVRLP